MQSKKPKRNNEKYIHYYIEAYLIGVYYASDAKRSKTKQNKAKQKKEINKITL